MAANNKRKQASKQRKGYAFVQSAKRNWQGAKELANQAYKHPRETKTVLEANYPGIAGAAKLGMALGGLWAVKKSHKFLTNKIAQAPGKASKAIRDYRSGAVKQANWERDFTGFSGAIRKGYLRNQLEVDPHTYGYILRDRKGRVKMYVDSSTNLN
jgi:hypothetical protein